MVQSDNLATTYIRNDVLEELRQSDNLVERALYEVVKDVVTGDITAIEELLGFVPRQNLIQFLPEDEWYIWENRR